MASMLVSKTNSPHNNNNSIKYHIDCKARITPDNPDTRDWLEITEQFDHDSPDYKVFRTILDKEKEVVAKLGPAKIREEYSIGAALNTLRLPTFLNYYCIFDCLDDFKSLNKARRFFCKESGKPIHVLIMPYLKDGQIDKWSWKRSNFNQLKNMLKHITISMLFAAKHIGFTHRDAHLGNIMVKHTRRAGITYGDLGMIELQGMMPVIMDYDRSIVNPELFWLVYDDLKRVFGLISTETDIQMTTLSIQRSLLKMFTAKAPITDRVVEQLFKEIDELEILYVKTEVMRSMS